jgi:RHS repeat-associated protein
MSFQAEAGTGCSYDANGNLTQDGTSGNKYTWDAEGLLSTFNGGTALVYDALGRRVEQTNASGTREILYGPDGSKVALMNGQALAEAFIALSGGATAVYSGSTLGWYRHPDWLGSSRIASTPSRTVYYDGEASYSPFGESPTETGNIDHNFTGQNQDLTSILYDFPAREYHPGEGRWISPDPAGLAAVDPTLPQSWNRYAYVLNDPLRNVDPTGNAYCAYDDGSVPWTDKEGATEDVCVNAEGGTWVPDEIDADGNPFKVEPDSFCLGCDFNITNPSEHQMSAYGQAVLQEMGNESPALNTVVNGLGIATAAEVALPLAWATAASSGSGGIATLASGTAEDSTVAVIHFTNEAGIESISSSGTLNANAWVTLPGEIPPGAMPSQIESLLEIAPGKGQFFVTGQTTLGNLAVPASGSLTSGGLVQYQLIAPIILP